MRKTVQLVKRVNFALKFAENLEPAIIGGLIKRFTNVPKIHHLKSLFLYN